MESLQAKKMPHSTKKPEKDEHLMSSNEARRSRDEAEDAVWESINETKEQVAAIDKNVGMLTTEVHGIRASVNHLSSAITKVSEEVSKSNKDLVDAINVTKTPNWQAYSVIAFVLVVLGGGVWTFNNTTIDHNSHISNVKFQQVKEVMEANNTHQTEVTDLKIENAMLQMKLEAKP